MVRELCGEVEQLVEELVPGQRAQDDQRGVAVRRVPTKSKRPLSFKVRQHKRKVLHIASKTNDIILCKILHLIIEFILDTKSL